MFGLGVWEFVIIAVVALIVLGPEKLPQVAQKLGRGMRELRRVTSDLQSTFEEAVYKEEDKRLLTRRPQVTPQIRAAEGTAAHEETAEPPAADEKA